jgi:agmatine/peptidylarginine deiminase
MVLPTADEIANPHLYHPRMSDRFVQPPPMWGPPPPAGSVRPGEFDPADSTVITIVNYNQEHLEMWVDMLEVYSQAGHTWIITTPQTKDVMEEMFGEAGIPADSYAYLNYPHNDIWVRDYGPEFAVAPDGERFIFDAQYHTGRPLDDVVPIRIGASDWINSDGSPMVVNTVEHMLSGGNVMSDGAGTCFFSHIIYGYEMPSGWTQEDVDELMAEYMGCEQVIVLNPICMDSTGHIDLYSKVMDTTSILLGEFQPDTHFDGTADAGYEGHCGSSTPEDYQDQEDNLATLEASTNLSDEPFTVTRIPVLEPYENGWGGWTYRTYLNSELFNDHVAMPSYYQTQGIYTAEELLDLEAAAILAYETARPGVVVTAISADHIIDAGGAIHCISHEIPAEEGGTWEPPAEYCGDGIINGDEECDGEDLAGLTCEDYDAGYGDYLMCDENCNIVADGCPGSECGDGIVGEDEECDPCAPEQELCADYELGDGQVGCNLDCTLNLYDCVDPGTPCEVLAQVDPGVVCCPDPPPTACDDGSWDWSPEDSWFGCCVQDLSVIIYCDGDEYYEVHCYPWYCGYQSTYDYAWCTEEEEPAQTDYEIDCPPAGEDDAGPDAGPGGKKDDDCGCRSVGVSSVATSLIALLLSIFS